MTAAFYTNYRANLRNAGNQLRHWLDFSNPVNRHGVAAMIIWGSSGREVHVGEGQFHCPQCDGTQPFFHKRIARYFTLYFIPLFPIANYGEHIQCGSCGGQYEMDVLNYRPPSQGERMALSLRTDLDSGLPLHMAQQKMISAGLDKETAQKMVEFAAEKPYSYCGKCNFYFRQTVRACTSCGGQLAARS